MTASAGHHAGSFGPGPGDIQRITVDAEGRASVSEYWARTAGFAKKSDRGRARPILFWLSEIGRAEGLSEVTHQLRINALLQDDDASVGEAASLVFFRGSYQPEPALLIPHPVIAHISTGAAIWAWTHAGVVELWSDDVRRRRTENAVRQIAPLMPSEEPKP